MATCRGPSRKPRCERGRRPRHPPPPARTRRGARDLLDAFGGDAEFYVFGSRARLDLRGGDLDLFVRVPGHAPDEAVVWRIEDRIEKAMDERHTDLLVLGTADEPQRIHRVAMETGVRF